MWRNIRSHVCYLYAADMIWVSSAVERCAITANSSARNKSLFWRMAQRMLVLQYASRIRLKFSRHQLHCRSPRCVCVSYAHFSPEATKQITFCRWLKGKALGFRHPSASHSLTSWPRQGNWKPQLFQFILFQFAWHDEPVRPHSINVKSIF